MSAVLNCRGSAGWGCGGVVCCQVGGMIVPNSSVCQTAARAVVCSR
jgi:hypothetical protein